MPRTTATTRRRLLGALTLVALATGPVAVAAMTDPTSTVDGARSEKGDRRIAYVGAVRDQPDLAEAGVGGAGHWFAQFDANTPTTGAPTGDNTRDALPIWVAAFNHTEHPADPGCTEADALARGCTPTYLFRTFSQDGPARSAGGLDDWARLRLPESPHDDRCGRAGAIVDPHTFTAEQDLPDPTGVVAPPEGQPGPNTNNTINRIQLQDGAPDRFFVGVLTDTTGGQHDPGRLEIRGNVGLLDQREEVADSQVEPVVTPTNADLATNGIPDVHVFIVEHFRTGDYLKLRLRGIDAPASFSGLVFDRNLDTSPPMFDPVGGNADKGQKIGHRKLASCPT